MININFLTLKGCSFKGFSKGLGHLDPFFLLVLFCLFCLFCLFSSCSTSEKRDMVFTKDMGLPYASTNPNQPQLMYQYYDFQTVDDENLLWTPVILPLLTLTNISLSDLLVGYKQNESTFFNPPDAGSCTFIASKRTEGVQKKLFSFVSEKEDPSLDGRSLFFAITPENQSIAALIKLNKYGKARCFLPRRSYLISTGFGLKRKDTLLQENDSEIKLSFPKVGSLMVSPKAENHIFIGDTIRIGRMPCVNQNSDALYSHFDDDIFQNSYEEPDKIDVEEFVVTSFLVGASPYEISLAEGDYAVAVLRENQLKCIRTVHLAEGQHPSVACPKENPEEDESSFYSLDSHSVSFEPNSYPDNFVSSEPFQNWYLYHKSSILFLSWTPNDIRKNSFLYLVNNGSDSYQTRVLSPFFLDEKNFEKTTDLFLKDMLNSNLYAVPFSRYFSLNFKDLELGNSFQKMDFQITNGVNIKIFDPILLENGVLSSLVAQKFRFRVFIPAWNPSDIVEMYLNDSLQKRWILDRGDISLPYAISLETQTFEKNNFTVRFVVRGQSSLSYFLTGREDEKPLMITQSYCVDQDESRSCKTL